MWKKSKTIYLADPKCNLKLTVGRKTRTTIIISACGPAPTIRSHEHKLLVSGHFNTDENIFQLKMLLLHTLKWTSMWPKCIPIKHVTAAIDELESSSKIEISIQIEIKISFIIFQKVCNTAWGACVFESATE